MLCFHQKRSASGQKEKWLHEKCEPVNIFPPCPSDHGSDHGSQTEFDINRPPGDFLYVYWWSKNSPPDVPILGMALSVKSKKSLQEVTRKSVLVSKKKKNNHWIGHLKYTESSFISNSQGSNQSALHIPVSKVSLVSVRTFLMPSIVPIKGRGRGPGIPSFLKNRYGHIPYLYYKKRKKNGIISWTVKNKKIKNSARMTPSYCFGGILTVKST